MPTSDANTPSRKPKETREQPWKTYLAAEQEAADKQPGGKEERPWIGWKPNPNEPFAKPWIAWNLAHGNDYASEQTVS